MKNLINSYLVLLLVLFLLSVYYGCSGVQPQTEHKSELALPEGPAPGIEMMKKGNLSFIESNLTPRDFGKERASLVKGQHPHTIVVTCSDSRVAPEYIFDRGLGEIFVVRTAGNVVDDVCLGSIEYAAEHLHAKEILVLGHSSCGAVTAALKGKTESPNINAILNYIFPSVESVKQKHYDEHEVLNATIEENARTQVYNILKSQIIRELYEKGELRIFMGIYNLENGFVRMYEKARVKEKPAPVN